MLKIVYIRNKIVEHSLPQITYKHINQYSADVFNYKINKTHNVNKHVIILITMWLLINVTQLTLMVHTL